MRLIVVLLSCFLLYQPAQAEKITFDDLYGIPVCSDPQISPDGQRIIFVLRTTDLSANSREKHLWIMNSDGSHLRQLTQGPTSEWHPRWSTDGKAILFLSDREDGVQVWHLSMEGGEARQVTSLSTAISAFECSPSGNELIFVSSVFPDCDSDSCSKARLDQQRNNPIKARLYDRLLFRHYNHWSGERINRLFLTDIADRSPREVYAGSFDVPTVLLGGYRDFAFSHDGREVCFAMSVDSTPAVSVNNDLYIIPTSGGEPVRITDSPGLETSPRYSPDGRYLMYHAQARAGYESDQRDLVLYDRTKGGHVNLTAEFDRSVGEYLWGAKSKYIYFAAVEYGFNMIWRLEVATRKVENLLGDAVYGELRLSPDGRFLVLRKSLSDEPYELYRYDLESRELTRLTRFTDEIVSELEMNRAEEFWFAGAMGDSVHGFLTRPPDFDPTEKYPLVLLIHGGPQGCWLGDFNYYGWNTQLVAAQGYVVAQIDPHGSVGYGIAFKEYVSGNWGRGDFEDIMKGVDYLIDACPYIDSTRMAAVGRSYGGFMVNWICGHTDRFACLISIDGTYNHLSEYGSTDELWFPEWEFKGTPWSNREEYVRSSPMTYADNFKTPTMVIHGQRDYRVDLSEGLQMFTALQRMGVPSQLLYFPDESHAVRGLKNRRYDYGQEFKWLARWLKP